MISPGAIVLRVRQKYGHGLRTAYYRDRVRPRILDTGPVRTAADGEVEVHALTSRGDLLNLLWALKSYYHFAERDYPLVLFEDGTLDDAGAETLRRHFPGARVVRKAEADALMCRRLERYPGCRRFRGMHPLAQKALDMGRFLRAPRMLLLDSDVLFFDRPAELLRRAEDPAYRQSAFNADVSGALNITAREAEARFGLRLVERINTGLAVVQREALNLAWMEEFLACESIWAGHPWRIEQTLLALAASRHGAELLPAEYRVSLEAGLDGCVVKHYVGAVRHLMYREGMARLSARSFVGRGRVRRKL